MSDIVVEARDVRCLFPIRKGLIAALTGASHHVHAVDAVSFTLEKGEILALVGESGCGKSTTGRVLLGLEHPTGGEIAFDGVDIATLSGNELKVFRRRAQMIFQNPFEVFDPRRTIRESLTQALDIHNIGTRDERTQRVITAMDRAGLTPADDFLDRYPHELSGGQAQRIATVRAMLLEPAFLVADEPVSMLDVSVRADILNQLLDLRDQDGMAIVFITHDLSAARYVADRIAVMYLGMFVETGPTEAIIQDPQHPYSQALLSHTLSIDSTGHAPMSIGSDVPTPIDIKPGCRFADRCPFVFDRCRTETPALLPVADNRQVACHLVEENGAGLRTRSEVT